MFPSDKNLERLIEKRKSQGTYYTLTTTHNTIDFCSNDFLGYSKSLDLKDRVLKFSKNLDSIAYIGSTGSRLISGNTALIESLENFVATYHHAESSLLFNSVFEAYMGLITSVAQRGDTIFYDAGIYPPIRDAIRLSLAKSYSFSHNDIDHLKKRMALARGNVYIVVEAVYYSDGDMACLKELSQFCASSNAHLIVDESHATGIFGNGGKGLVVQNELTSKVFARILSFAKALGCQGAAVLGSNLLRNYLINFSQPFIFSTALPFNSYISIKSAYDLLNEDEEGLNILHDLISHFVKQVSASRTELIDNYIESKSPIQCFKLNNIEKLKHISNTLYKSGFDIKPLLYPMVSKGKERIKVCLHTFNTKDEINSLIKTLAELY